MSLTADQRILHQRAVELAREEQSVEDLTEGFDVTAFRLGNELYALESCYIRGIVPLKGAVSLPCVPAYIAGIMNLRGRILSLLDLRCLFSLPCLPLYDAGKVIILSGNGMEFGILAESIEGVRRISLKDLQEDLPTLGEREEKYLRGLTPERLILLDGSKMLCDLQLVVNEEIG